MAAVADEARDLARPGPTRWPFSVTVAMPALNEAHVVAEVIQSVRVHCPEAEILVVADGSTDGTPEVAEAAGARVVRHPYNMGNGAAI